MIKILEMSEVQLIEPTSTIEEDNVKMDEPDSKISEVIKSQPEADETADLEDGEIDDDDDDDNADDGDVIITSVVQGDDIKKPPSATFKEKPKTTTDDIVTIDLVDDSVQPSPPKVKPAKSKKSKPLEEDHAGSIESALAKVLKKKGIEPVLPVLDSRSARDEQPSQQSSSRSSRRRKRKKQREEKEKQKGSSEKKKSRYESPDAKKGKIHEIEDDDENMEDFEMLNVRGGSPPPMAHLPAPILPAYKDQYDSVDDSNYSYDSYDSGNDVESPSENRRKRRNKKEKDSRKRRGGGGGGGRNRKDSERQEKNHRRGDSPDRQEPRKLELCKFYLMECCAKRDKCSYMHSDFPCKYYYLGMECTQKDDCKFGHGEPLTEQLRNILLKHLETAPKEILGNFKRISREQAITQMTRRHEELCQKFNVQNVWSIFPNIPTNHNRRGGNHDHQQNQQQQQKQQQQQQHQQQQQQNQLQQQLQQNPMLHNIPSLLDLDIKPPTGDLNDLSIVHEKPRKSRWCDSAPSDVKGRSNLEPPPNNAPSYLDLKNLKGILSEEHIQQLSDLGIVNLEQVNQLTVGQLNKIGLTIAEINEIQLNAKNMAKLGVPVGGGNGPLNAAVLNIGATAAAIDEKSPPKTDKSSHGDNQMDEAKAPAIKSLQEESLNSNSSSNSGVIMVDYSQYLKDSNLPFERGDDDERDDEQLIIDDGNTDNEDSPFGTPSKSQNRRQSGDEKRKDSQSDSEQPSQPPIHSLHKLQIPEFTNALRNPFSSIPAFSKQIDNPRMSSHFQSDLDVFKPNDDDHRSAALKKAKSLDNDSDDERYYASRGRRSRSVTPTRSGGSSTPEGSSSPKADDFSGGHKKKPRTNPKYERQTMYDYDVKRVLEEDAAHAAKSIKADKDMRFMEGAGVGSGDIDLRLPFLPVTNYTPATEIDGSITSHLPMTYKVYEVDIPNPNYVELRQNFKSDQTSDPRLRRILGLPETPTSRTAVELSRSVRKASNSIASPESSDGASPKYYTPSMSSTSSAAEERGARRNSHSHSQRSSEKSSSDPTQTGKSQLRMDPRRAARQAASTATASSQNSPPVTTTAAPNNANKQNIEIRNYLQKSEWYKNLNSKFKIMVNQQLALVSTELKKFHQDPSPTKIFDISFIVNNSTLQQILTNLGVYIDDNGEVAHIDGDGDEGLAEQASQNALNNKNIVLPNLSQPPPSQLQPQQQQQQQQQLDFLRAPPPNMFGQAMNVQQFNTPPPNARPSLLGIPPGVPGVPRNPFNPFAGNVPVPVPFVGGPPSLLGPGPVAVPGMNTAVNFPNFVPPNMQQQKRNFSNNNNNRNNQQRNQQRQRRNNFNNASGNA